MTGEAERIIIGGWLQGEHTQDIKKISASDFQAYPHVVQAIKSKGIDVLTVAKESGEKVTELAKIVTCYSKVFYESAIATLYEQKAREFLAKSESKSLEEIAKVLGEFNQGKPRNIPTPAKDLAINYWQELDERKKRDVVLTGITGLDMILCGIRTKELTSVGARPSVGKSAFMLQVAVQIAKQNKRVLYFPLEMSTTQTVERIILRRLDIPQGKLRRGDLTREQWESLSKASDEVQKLEDEQNFLIFESVNDIADIQELVAKYKPYAIVIDQLEQMNSHKHSFKDKRERFSHMTNSLKRLSMTDNVAVMLACQVNRSAQDSEPTLANLKESGSIEEDSDNVILLHRIPVDKMLNPNAWSDSVRPMQINVAKQRSGGTGTINAKFECNKYTFYEVT